MSNYKALGIEKEMNEEFNLLSKSELQFLMESCYFDNPNIVKRKQNEEYCEIEVIDCPNNFWYKNLIGQKFFCKIRWRDYGRGRFISEFLGVKLTSTKEIQFRAFSPSDVIII